MVEQKTKTHTKIFFWFGNANKEEKERGKPELKLESAF